MTRVFTAAAAASVLAAGLLASTTAMSGEIRVGVTLRMISDNGEKHGDMIADEFDDPTRRPVFPPDQPARRNRTVGKLCPSPQPRRLVPPARIIICHNNLASSRPQPGKQFPFPVLPSPQPIEPVSMTAAPPAPPERSQV